MQKEVFRLAMACVVAMLPYWVFSQERATDVPDETPLSGDHVPQALIGKLKELEKTFVVRFMYDPELLEDKFIIRRVDNGSLVEQLNEILLPFNLRYERIEKEYYAIAFGSGSGPRTDSQEPGYGPGPAAVRDGVSVLDSNNRNRSADSHRIHGRVIAENSGDVVPGVSIMVKGTHLVTMTDESGEFEIAIPGSDAVMVFTYIGYRSEIRSVHAAEHVEVALQPETKALEQIVVTGYANTPLKDVTGSVSIIRSDEVRRVPVISADHALQGHAAGVFVSNSHANPGGETNVRIRGINSILGNNEPLYVIDGYIGGDINAVNPGDIESIDILKDASSTAIFGTRGSNGVVMITTKRGTKKSRAIAFDSFYGFQTLGNKLDMMKGRDYAAYINRIDADMGKPLSYPDPNDIPHDTDWQEEITRTAPWHQHMLSARGDVAGVLYYLSGSYTDQQGIVKETGFTRSTVRANIDAPLNDVVTLGIRLGGSQIDRTVQDGEEFGRRDDTAHPVARALILQPTAASRDADGELYSTVSDYAGILRANPAFWLENIHQKFATNNVTGSLFADVKLSKALTFRASLGLERHDSRMSRFKSPILLETTTGYQSTARLDVTLEKAWLQENYFTYLKNWGHHSFQGVAGTTLQSHDVGLMSIIASDLPDDVVFQGDVPLGVGKDRYSAESSRWRQASAFSRLHYTWKDKYLVTFNGRYDGNSKFGEDRRWAFFPSGAVAWRLSEEPFLKNAGFSGDIKVRSSYGVSGSEALGPYNSIAAMTSDDAGYIIGDKPVRSYYFSRLANPHLQWEQTVQFDVGVDAGMLGGRLTLVVDYFDKTTRNLFLEQRVPETTGVKTVSQNIGALRNAGLEMSVLAKPVKGSFNWQIGANATFLTSSVLSLDGRSEFATGPLNGGYNVAALQLVKVGEPLGSYYGYRTDGVWQPSEIEHSYDQFGSPVAAGDLKLIDLNADGEVNEADRDIIGRAQPRFYGSLNSVIGYRNFDLSFFFTFVGGNHVFNGLNLDTRNTGSYTNKHVSMLNSWTPENPDTDIPRAGSRTPKQVLDIWLEDASFLRLREISIGYTLPSSLLQRVGIDKLRIYATGVNLLTLTEYTGYDPEVNISAGSIDIQNFDNGSYPRAKSIVMGMNLIF